MLNILYYLVDKTNPVLILPIIFYFQEHFYDASSGTGYLAWCLKTVQRNTFIGEKRRPESSETSSGPLSEREPFSTTEQLTGDECREAISVMKHSSDENIVKEKMKATFQYRQSIVRHPEKSQDVLDLFSRFLDTPRLVSIKVSISYFFYLLCIYAAVFLFIFYFSCKRSNKIFHCCLEKRSQESFLQNGQLSSNPK